MTEIDEPPFHGEACPMCPSNIRGPLATLHNFFCDWPDQGRWGEHLYDLQLKDRDPPHSDNSNVEALLQLVHKLRRIPAREEGGRRFWKTEDVAPVLANLEEIYTHLFEVDLLSQAHFFDERHYRPDGRNVLRSERSSGQMPWIPAWEHNYWVRSEEPERYDEGYEAWKASADAQRLPDLTHQRCGTKLWLAEHFRTVLKADPTFYALVYCTHCQANYPFEGFDQSKATE